MEAQAAQVDMPALMVVLEAVVREEHPWVKVVVPQVEWAAWTEIQHMVEPLPEDTVEVATTLGVPRGILLAFKITCKEELKAPMAVTI